MKRKQAVFILFILILLPGLIACMDQKMARKFGGSMELELPANQKLEEITWKDDALWYLTRPMHEDEEAETHTFQASSEWGVFEGTVTVIEKKEDKK